MSLLDLWPGLRDLDVINVEKPNQNDTKLRLFTVRLIGSDFLANIYMKEDQIRALREAITKALDEQPQDESEKEQLKSFMSDAWEALTSMSEVIYDIKKPATV